MLVLVLAGVDSSRWFLLVQVPKAAVPSRHLQYLCDPSNRNPNIHNNSRPVLARTWRLCRGTVPCPLLGLQVAWG